MSSSARGVRVVGHLEGAREGRGAISGRARGLQCMVCEPHCEGKVGGGGRAAV